MTHKENILEKLNIDNIMQNDVKWEKIGFQ
jgi:hypothetical protein